MGSQAAGVCKQSRQVLMASISGPEDLLEHQHICSWVCTLCTRQGASDTSDKSNVLA